jgi:pyruvate carboxylase subunit B
MLHATKGKNFDLGGLELEKILKYEDVLNDCLKDYFMPPEATQVSPLIPFSPMPGGALTANTQMLRDNNILNRYPEVIKAMREVVERGGYGTSVTPVSQFYWQQAFSNVMQGPWKKIAPGYGKMVLGYFGKTPVEPDPEILKIASEQLKLEPTKESAIDIADRDERKTIAYWSNILKKENIETTDENIFIAASCDQKGIAFLKGEAPLMVRKKGLEVENNKEKAMSSGSYTVVVDGQKFSVQVAEGDANIEIKNIEKLEDSCNSSCSGEVEEITASVPGTVWKIVKNPGEMVEADETILILEAMKMEIDIKAPKAGKIERITVSTNDKVTEGQVLAVLS